MKTNETAVHATIYLTINGDSSWDYSEPKVQRNFQMHVPVRLFNGKATGEALQDIIEEMVKAMPEAAKEYEERVAKEEAEKEAKKKAEQEANISN